MGNGQPLACRVLRPITYFLVVVPLEAGRTGFLDGVAAESESMRNALYKAIAVLRVAVQTVLGAFASEKHVQERAVEIIVLPMHKPGSGQRGKRKDDWANHFATLWYN